jgi:hypothetical protein
MKSGLSGDKSRWNELRCILCEGEALEYYYGDNSGRVYLRCPDCGLVFVPPEMRPGPEEELCRYRMHRNSPDDRGYRSFLERLAGPLDSLLAGGSRGLDFGSGPMPVLSGILADRGHVMALYDPFFARGPSVFDREYDFITATEVLEHLHEPGRELERLWSVLRYGGYLGIMTEPLPGRDAFAGWHYRRDITHVTFYSEKTFRWLCDKFKAEKAYRKNNVLILKKI